MYRFISDKFELLWKFRVHSHVHPCQISGNNVATDTLEFQGFPFLLGLLRQSAELCIPEFGLQTNDLYVMGLRICLIQFKVFVLLLIAICLCKYIVMA